MDTTRNPGIGIDLIRLVSAKIDMADPKAERVYGVTVTDWQRTLTEDGKHLTVVAAFDLAHGVENPPFRFTCSFIARYTRDSEANMSWDEFPDHVALAHIVPYLREFVTNMTARLPVAPLMLPPMNTAVLLADLKCRRETETGSTTP